MTLVSGMTGWVQMKQEGNESSWKVPGVYVEKMVEWKLLALDQWFSNRCCFFLISSTCVPGSVLMNLMRLVFPTWSGKTGSIPNVCASWRAKEERVGGRRQNRCLRSVVMCLVTAWCSLPGRGDSGVKALTWVVNIREPLWLGREREWQEMRLERLGRAASCWSVEAVVRDLKFNPRVMGGLRRVGLPALPPPPFPFREF